MVAAAMSVVYVLTTPIPEDDEKGTVDQIRQRNKWDNDEYVCRCLILEGMSHPLFNIYQNVESRKELWDSFEAKYMAEDASNKKFLVNNFTNYKMTDLRPVMEQYNELLGIKVSQGKDCVEIKQERYAMNILKEAGMEDCIATSCPIEPRVKLSKAEDEPEVVGYLRYLLHTRPDLTYLVGVRGNDMILVEYNIHNVDTDDGRSTIGHVFYLGTSPITWCSQKQTTVALSSCEAKFMAATAAACQEIWLRDILAEVMENEHVQGDEIVYWYARVTLFDSEIHGVIIGEFLTYGYGWKRGP
uniref:Zinc finger, CCHC-type n=1 Tax=Tanacetum cinerariifolium TaxID=118510 RepID=A0A6L2P6M0_TANCI|nr:zinc finger, CCHC-type [Tanacetum cinerariifolium]